MIVNLADTSKYLDHSFHGGGQKISSFSQPGL